MQQNSPQKTSLSTKEFQEKSNINADLIKTNVVENIFS